MANEKRLIDANALKEAMWNTDSDVYEFCQGRVTNMGISRLKLDDMIDDCPTVDAVEVVHAKWEKAHIAGYLKCNSCKDAFIYEEWLKSGKWNYCPNCGAKMDGEMKDDGK